MQRLIEDALDELLSPRSSVETHGQALLTLEQALANVLVGKRNADEYSLQLFLRLQDLFQYNMSSRIVAWLAGRTERMKHLADGKALHADEDEFRIITLQVLRSLSLLQGVALMHTSSKRSLGRKYSLEVLLELLSVCRHSSSRPFTNCTNSPSKNAQSRSHPFSPSLASTVLDTLLCILVDSPQSIRTFEEANGVELIVKVLKRASIPRDVRMKCLEFLYFYLLDESLPESSSPMDKAPTCPSSPLKQSTPRIMQCIDDSATSASPSSSESVVSTAPNSAFSSFSSWSPTPTVSGTPPQSPTKRSGDTMHHVHKSLAMLRNDVDFVPLSPKKAQIAKLGLGNRRGVEASPFKRGISASTHMLQRKFSPLSRMSSEETLLSDDGDDMCGAESVDDGGDKIRSRSTEEKKKILGELLGNVDALVEGVKKAGIWGLGQ